MCRRRSGRGRHRSHGVPSLGSETHPRVFRRRPGYRLRRRLREGTRIEPGPSAASRTVGRRRSCERAVATKIVLAARTRRLLSRHDKGQPSCSGRFAVNRGEQLSCPGRFEMNESEQPGRSWRSHQHTNGVAELLGAVHVERAEAAELPAAVQGEPKWAAELPWRVTANDTEQPSCPREGTARGTRRARPAVPRSPLYRGAPWDFIQ